MRHTLTFFHTAPAARETISALMNELAPDIPVRHVLDPQPLDQAIAACKVTSEIATLAGDRMQAAIDAETAVLVCTCSTLGGVTDHLSHLWVPILRIDRPMAIAAAQAGSRVLVAACLESTVDPTRSLVEDEGSRHMWATTRDWRRTFSSQVVRIPEAWPLFLAGDKPAYWAKIAERLREAAPGFDAIVLAQASMAGAADFLADLGIPVLSSPRLGVQGAIEVYRKTIAAQTQPSLLDAVCRLHEEYPQTENQSLVMKMAIMLLEQAENPHDKSGAKRMRITADEYFKTPGRWELLDGILVDSAWPPEEQA